MGLVKAFAERDGYVIVQKLEHAGDVAEPGREDPDRRAEGVELTGRIDERTRRIGLNEALFREVNERVEEVADTFGVPADELPILCECGDANCTAQLAVSGDAYRETRSDPGLFLLAPGHEAADVEEVVRRAGGYEIVRKRPGAPEKIARETA